MQQAGIEYWMTLIKTSDPFEIGLIVSGPSIGVKNSPHVPGDFNFKDIAWLGRLNNQVQC